MPLLVPSEIRIQLDADFPMERSRYQSVSKAAGKAKNDLC